MRQLARASTDYEEGGNRSKAMVLKDLMRKPTVVSGSRAKAKGFGDVATTSLELQIE